VRDAYQPAQGLRFEEFNLSLLCIDATESKTATPPPIPPENPITDNDIYCDARSVRGYKWETEVKFVRWCSRMVANNHALA